MRREKGRNVEKNLMNKERKSRRVAEKRKLRERNTDNIIKWLGKEKAQQLWMEKGRK